MMTRIPRIFSCAVLLVALAITAVAQTPATKQVEVFGQKINYIEAGSGPNVILLHGLGADATNWAMTIPALAKNYHVWAPDQIGFLERVAAHAEGQAEQPFVSGGGVQEPAAALRGRRDFDPLILGPDFLHGRALFQPP